MQSSIDLSAWLLLPALTGEFKDITPFLPALTYIYNSPMEILLQVQSSVKSQYTSRNSSSLSPRHLLTLLAS